MPEVKPEALRALIKSGELSGCFLFCGPEHYLIERYREMIRSQLFGAADDPFNFRRIDGRSFSVGDLREAIDSYPSFAEHTLVEVTDCDIFSLPEADASEFIKVIASVPEYCCLLFVYEAIEFKQDKRKKALCEAVKKSIRTITFPIQGQRDLIDWIVRHFRSEKKEITRDDAEYLLFVCGSSMENLGNEIGKIAVYSDEKTVTRSDIDAVVIPVLDAQVFRMTEALLSGNTEKAVELLGTLFRMNTEPIMINAALGAQLRKLYAAKLVRKNGGGVPELKEIYGTDSDYAPRQNLRLAQGFSEDQCKAMIALSAETDYRMKSSGEDPTELIRTLFLRLTVS